MQIVLSDCCLCGLCDVALCIWRQKFWTDDCVTDRFKRIMDIWICLLYTSYNRHDLTAIRRHASISRSCHFCIVGTLIWAEYQHHTILNRTDCQHSTH